MIMGAWEAASGAGVVDIEVRGEGHTRIPSARGVFRMLRVLNVVLEQCR